MDKGLRDIVEKANQLIDESNTQKQNEVIASVCKDIISTQSAVEISPSLLEELRLNEWVSKFCQTKGGECVLRELISAPTYDRVLIQARGTILRDFELQKCSYIQEDSVLWILGMPTNIKDAYPLPILFTCLPLLKYLNNFDMFVFGMYMLKAYILPVINVAQPTLSFLGPYFYVRRYLKIQMKFMTYLNFLRSGFMLFMRPSGNLRADAFKYITVIIYVLLYVYTIVHGFELAGMLRRVKCDLAAKWERIYSFIQSARHLCTPKILGALRHFAQVDNVATCKWRIFDLTNSMSSLYRALTDSELRHELSMLLKITYVYDAICSSQAILKHTPGWSVCKYGDTTQLFNMGHPMLTASQVRNPLLMNKNIIITGPNAAGKTTYMKSICANMILAQSLGICCASRAVVCPVHSILSSMNIIDTVGRESLFEAEVRRCSLLVKQADTVKSKGERALFFLDEPMHSTPPMEGTATAIAVSEYLGNTPGVFVFLTTHYHHVTRLETMYPDKWINVSMEAIAKDDGSFVFPYRLKKGLSTQCIALELLKDRALPDEVIESAIEIKNKICGAVLDNVNVV